MFCSGIAAVGKMKSNPPEPLVHQDRQPGGFASLPLFNEHKTEGCGMSKTSGFRTWTMGTFFLIMACAICLLTGPAALAKDYMASLAQMPVYAESKDKGVLVDFTKALAAASGDTIKYQVVPFKRSMAAVIDGKVDFHMPLIQNPNIPEAKLPYDHSTATIFHVNFVLFSNKSKPLDMKNLGKYKIDTDAAHVAYFPFKTNPSSNLESSLKKLNAGRIDGFIFADVASDPIVKKLKLSNLKRQLYKRFDVKIILPKGGKGGPTDQMISAAIGKMKKNGQFEKIMGVLDTPYNDWQP
jgi:polar amino acid transport system substrate-binding protein